jgi:hypothetical protein
LRLSRYTSLSGHRPQGLTAIKRHSKCESSHPFSSQFEDDRYPGRRSRPLTDEMEKRAAPPASTQCRRFLRVKAKNSINPGTQAYLISASWFLSWKSFVGLIDPARESPPPP